MCIETSAWFSLILSCRHYNKSGKSPLPPKNNKTMFFSLLLKMTTSELVNNSKSTENAKLKQKLWICFASTHPSTYPITFLAGAKEKHRFHTCDQIISWDILKQVSSVSQIRCSVRCLADSQRFRGRKCNNQNNAPSPDLVLQVTRKFRVDSSPPIVQP